MEDSPEDKGASKAPEKPESAETGSKIRRPTKASRRPSKCPSQVSQKEKSSTSSLPQKPSSRKHQDGGPLALQGVPTKQPTPTSTDIPASTGRQEKLPEYQSAADQPDAVASRQRPLSQDHGTEILKTRRSSKLSRKTSKASTLQSETEKSSAPNHPQKLSIPKLQDSEAQPAQQEASTTTLADVSRSADRQDKPLVYQPPESEPEAFPTRHDHEVSRVPETKTAKTRLSVKASRRLSKSSQQSQRRDSSALRPPLRSSSSKLQDGEDYQAALKVAPIEAPTPTSGAIPGSTGRQDELSEHMLTATRPDASHSSQTQIWPEDQETEATKSPSQTKSTNLVSTASDSLATGVRKMPGMKCKTSDSSLIPTGPAHVPLNQDQTAILTTKNEEVSGYSGELAPVILSGDSVESGVRIMPKQDNALDEALSNQGQCPGVQETEDTDMRASSQKQSLVTTSNAGIVTAETTSNILGTGQEDTVCIFNTSQSKEEKGLVIGSSQGKPACIVGLSEHDPERVISQHQTEGLAIRKAASNLEGEKSQRPTGSRSDRNSGSATLETRSPPEVGLRQAMHKRLGELYLFTAATNSCSADVVCAAIIIIVLAFVAVFAFFLIGGEPEKPRHDICSTQACEAYSRRLLDSMNVSVNPCESFTHYVCDGWSRDNELSVNEDTMRAALDRLYRFVIDLKVSHSGQTPFERAAIFYRSCLCVGRGKCDQLPEVASALLESGIVWPHQARSPDVLRTLLFSSLRLRWNGLFSLEMKSNTREKHLFLRVADELFLLKGKMDEHLRVSEARRQRYFQVLSDHFGRLNTKHENLVSFDETLDLEENEFDNLFQSAQKQPAAKINFLADGTIANLTEQRWRDALIGCGVEIKPEDSLVFSSNDITFVYHFVLVWAKGPDELVHLLISWCTVQVAALFANQELLVNFYGSQAKAELRNGISCFSKTFLITGRDVLYGYSNYFLPHAFLPMAEVLVLEIREAFRRRVLGWEHYDKNVTVVHDWNSTEMAMKYFYDPGTGDANGQTGSTKPTQTGEKHLDHEAFKGDSLVANWRLAAEGLLNNPTSIDLSNAIENRDEYLFVRGEGSPDLSLLPYAFTFPYFDREDTRAFNYAGVGTIVAEALGRLFLNAKFSSIKAQRAINAFIYCMEDSMPGKLNRRNYGRHVEPISLMTSLDAYRANSEALRRDQRVKGLEFLSTEQLFFVAACFTRCTGRHDSRSAALVNCDDTFTHVPEFAAAFECQPSALMNPEKRCKLL